MNISKRSLNIIVISIYVITLLCGAGALISNDTIEFVRKILMFTLPTLMNASMLIDQKGNFSKIKDYKGYLILIILNLTWYIVTIIFGINIGGQSLTGFINFTNIILLVFFITHVNIDEENKKKIINAFIYSALICSVYGILQYIFKFDLNTFSNDKYPGINGRVPSTFFLPTLYDKYACIMFALVSYLTLKEDKLLYKILYVIIGINIVLTFSRGGFIALIIVVLVHIIRTIMLKKWTNLILPLLLVIISFLIPGFAYLFQNTANYVYEKLHIPTNLRMSLVEEVSDDSVSTDPEDDMSISFRNYYKGIGKQIIKEYPVLGIGLNNYSYIYNNQNVTLYIEDTSVLEENLPYMYPHSGFVQMGAETGYVGLVLILVYLIYVCYDYIRYSDNKFKYFPLLILVLFFLGNYTESLIQNKQYMYIFIIFYGLFSNRYELKKKK
nr:O-antigen ligase family protein [Bacilli bacterium]